MAAERLDTVLVRRGLARSRTQAVRLIGENRVRVAGRVACKPSATIDPDVELVVDAGEDWASRGAHKLIGALDTFAIEVAGCRVLDAGASTGGFTDVLLRRGAAAVAAVDVGAGQLVPRLADDSRVHVHDNTNIRALSEQQRERIRTSLGGAADLVVADLSFISLTLVLPTLIALAADDATLLPMVKPQFEVGRGRLGAHGVVRDPALRAEAVGAVVEAAAALGWGVAGVSASPLPGPSGNVEYFVQLARRTPTDVLRASLMIDEAIRGGVQ